MTSPATLTHYSSPALAGPLCRSCGATEQQCAYQGGCCVSGAGCSHWLKYDADGNDKPALTPTVWAAAEPGTTTPCPLCGRDIYARLSGRRLDHRTRAYDMTAPYCPGGGR